MMYGVKGPLTPLPWDSSENYAHTYIYLRFHNKEREIEEKKIICPRPKYRVFEKEAIYIYIYIQTTMNDEIS